MAVSELTMLRARHAVLQLEGAVRKRWHRTDGERVTGIQPRDGWALQMRWRDGDVACEIVNGRECRAWAQAPFAWREAVLPRLGEFSDTLQFASSVGSSRGEQR